MGKAMRHTRYSFMVSLAWAGPLQLSPEMPADTGNVISAEFVEVNPALDAQNGTAKLAVGLLASLLGKKIL